MRGHKFFLRLALMVVRKKKNTPRDRCVFRHLLPPVSGFEKKKHATLTLHCINKHTMGGGHSQPQPHQVMSLRTVPNVDLARYSGKWYEVARLPVEFEAANAYNVTAEYKMVDDNTLAVQNTQILPNGTVERIRGYAQPIDPQTKAKWLVFFPSAHHHGKYYVIDLVDNGTTYTYAVVGDPKRKHLWILSRTPRIDDLTYLYLLKRAKAQGFDVSRVRPTLQITRADLERVAAARREGDVVWASSSLRKERKEKSCGEHGM